MNTDVINAAKDIRKKVLENTLNKNDFPKFQARYPKFYCMLQNKYMNEEMFEKLITILSVKSADDQNAASEFSQYGAERYLYPQFGKPSKSDIDNAKLKVDKLS